jgi:hypothetical protein
MKKSLVLISLTTLTFLFGCKKEENNSPYDIKYTNETTEQSKQNVEQNAVDLVDQLDALSTTTAIEVLMNLNDLQNSQVQVAYNPVLTPMASIGNLNQEAGMKRLFEAMKASGEMLAEGPLSFSELIDSLQGKYTYDFQTGEFIETPLENQIVFEFPGKKTDLTNTAVITVNNITVVEITDPFQGWPDTLSPELPASITVDLKYNNESVAGVSFVAAYQSNGMPTSVTVEVYVDDFTFTTKAVHSPFSSASWTNTMKFQSDILMETFIAANGNWSDENIDANVTTTSGSDEWGSWTETEVHIEEIIRNANAHVILMNLKVVGTVNIKALGDAIWALEESQNEMTEEEFAQAAVDAINANAKLVVIYRDSNTKIAEAEAYVENYYDSYYETTEYKPSMRFVYADGSKVDVETYVNSELDGFYQSVNDFIDKLNAQYNLNIEYVSPDAGI